jgi:hypothetical protein
LLVGQPISLEDARAGFDIIILSRGKDAPDADVIDAPGHVGFFAGMESHDQIAILGGNQSNSVNVRRYSKKRLLGVRRLLFT